MAASCSVLCIILLIVQIKCNTIFLEMNTPTPEEASFLRRYGYLPEVQGDIGFSYTPQSIAEAVKKMQQFAGLPATGNLDEETRSLFKKKRCGVKDIENSPRSRRYILQQGWGKKAITYRVLNGSSTLERERVRALMALGLAVWAPHGGCTSSSWTKDMLTYKSLSPARTTGTGRVVAHAFPPPHGAMHFDDDEVWGDGDSDDAADDDVTDFFAVAVHEIGHALGLSHSNVKASVMYPYYQVPVEKLHMDDILGMQELYLKEELPSSGESTERASQSSLAPHFTQTADSREEDLPDLCLSHYDTIQVIYDKIYVFEEEWVWVFRDRRELEEGYPRRIHDVFIGLPKHVQFIRAIYQKINGNIVIFSGRNYWEFSRRFRLVRRGRAAEFGLPRRIELTTAFLSNYNNRTYLISDDHFWRYDERRDAMDRGYPKHMAAWRRIPSPVEAAMVWKGDTYFFCGPRFWRFDNERVEAHAYYPLPTAQIWFPCDSTPEMNKYLTNDES